MVDVEEGLDERLFDLAPGVGVEQGDLEDVVLLEHLARDAHLLRHQPAGGDAAALAVAAVVHLDRRLVDVLAADGDRAGEAGDAAAAFRFRRAGRPRSPSAAGAARARSRDCTRPSTSTLAAFVRAVGHRCRHASIFIIQVDQQVGAAAQGGHGVESQAVQDVHQHLAARRCTGSPAAACTTRR